MSDLFFNAVAECAILMDPPASDRMALIGELIEAGIAAGTLSAALRREATDAVMRREQIEGTLLPDGIGFPHGRMEGLDRIALVLGINRRGIDLGAPDGQPTRFILLMLVPVNAGAGYVKILGRFCRKMTDPVWRERLLAAVSADEVRQILVS